MSRALQRIGQTLTPYVDRFATKLTDDLMETVASQVPAPRQELWTSVRANLGSLSGAMSEGGLTDEWEVPSDALDFARLCARRGIPESSLVMFYHRAQNLFELDILTLIADEVPLSDLSSSPFEILGEFRIFTTEYMTRVTSEVRITYQEEAALQSTLGSPESLRTVLDLLNATGEVPAAIDGHDLAGRHIAAILRLPEDPFELEVVAGELARTMGALRQPLIVQPNLRTAWVWLQVGTEADPPPNGLSETVLTAVGGAATGVDGFRTTHHRARACDHLGRMTNTPPGTTISDWNPGTISAGFFADQPRKAIELVHTVLGPLAADDEESRVLRETARAYLLHGSTEAARLLVVHRNTVKYRIDRVRELIGSDELASPDLSLALELARWFRRA